MLHVEVAELAERLLKKNNVRSSFTARQLMLASLPATYFIENYLNDNSGRLQSLEGFPMMRQIYDHLPQQLLLKCSRKTLKSTLLSNMICLNMIRFNYYNMMYIGPQEATAKYFSGNYLPPRFDSPKVRKLLLKGFRKDDIFEKILDDTKSSCLFKYVSDDATRTRGPASDHVMIDECISGSSVVTCDEYGSRKSLLELTVGQPVLAFDVEGNLVLDKVKNLVSKGRRPSWRITLETGEFLECTANERIFSNQGWLYLAQLLPEEEVSYCPAAMEVQQRFPAFHVHDVRLYRHSTGTTMSLCSISGITYAGNQDVYDIETEVHHTFFANGVAVHNCQNVEFDQIPIILEVSAMSPYKRELYAGTPLDSANAIHKLWLTSNQLEWFTKCEGCNHWNALIEGNQPFEMIRPNGLSCSKCSRLLNTRNGEWVAANPGKSLITGYHLAQPILPHYNEDPKEWKSIYSKVHEKDTPPHAVMNETFGLSYDIGSKPITQEELIPLCKLGEQHTGGDVNQLAVLNKNKAHYRVYTMGVDWGVSMVQSRTVATLGAMRADGVYEVIMAKVYKGLDYVAHIKDIAMRANAVNAFCVSDSGPDPIRGHLLCEATSIQRSQLVAYRRSKMIQHFEPGAYDWRQNRWVLHRSDVISLVLRQLKAGKILFPKWDDISDYMQDFLNIYMDVRDGMYGQEVFYSHKADQPDDAMHSLVFAVCSAYLAVGDACLTGPSTSAQDGVEGLWTPQQ